MPHQRIAVLHRNCLFRDSLVTFLRSTSRYEGLSIDHTSAEFDEAELIQVQADVFLVDLNLPNNLAIRIAQLLQGHAPRQKLIVLVPDDFTNLLECIAAGVHGCVMERSTLAELETSIAKAIEGETVCSGPFAATMFAEISRVSWRIPSITIGFRLTARELEVLELLAQRYSNKQIAKRLSVSIFTVKNHVHSILEKLDVESRVEAVDRARSENLIGNP